MISRYISLPRLLLGFNTRYTTHCYETEASSFEDEEISYILPDRPIFKGIERSVPASAFSRVWNFAVLGGSLVGGTFSSALQSGFSGSVKDFALSDANIERVTEGLLRMRGAALKIGQFLSFQEEGKMPPSLIKAMERTRREAYIMPGAQLERVLNKELGTEWQSIFDEFDMMPFAAASIGQVHKAKYKGQDVAVKVQYPGVDISIDSDLNNLQRLFQWGRVLPRELFFDELVKHTRDDLYNECNYLLEAEHQNRFRELLANNQEFYIPKAYTDISTKHVLVTEFLDSYLLEEFARVAPQKLKDSVGTRILEITIREIFEFNYMQTDPNPANFQYDFNRDQLDLLDFGATRSYDREFIEKYRKVVVAGVEQDRENSIYWSDQIGYFNGDEDPEMFEAHVRSIYAVGEPLRHPGIYDFGNQKITNKIYEQLPALLKYRKSPPPPETYSLHRKLSGAYLLCMKLKAKVPANDLYKKYIRIN